MIRSGTEYLCGGKYDGRVGLDMMLLIYLQYNTQYHYIFIVTHSIFQIFPSTFPNCPIFSNFSVKNNN